MTTKRSAAAATIFSRVCAPPPPLTSQPSGATWSAPSIAMSSRSSASNGSTESPSSRAARSVAGEVATQRMLEAAVGERRQQVGDRRAGAQSDRHAVLDQLRGGLGGGALLAIDGGSGATAGNLRGPSGRAYALRSRSAESIV